MTHQFIYKIIIIYCKCNLSIPISDQTKLLNKHFLMCGFGLTFSIKSIVWLFISDWLMTEMTMSPPADLIG